MTGWIAISRDLFAHGFFAREPMSEREAWIWMIARAAWKDTTHRMGRETVDVPRGAFFCTLRELQQEWGWGSDTRVRNFIKRLEAEGMVNAGKDAKKTQITICNYDEFQNMERTENADENETQKKRKENANFVGKKTQASHGNETEKSQAEREENADRVELSLRNERTKEQVNKQQDYYADASAGAEIVDFPDQQSVPKNRTAEPDGRPVPHDKAERKPAPQQCHCGRRACAGVNCQGILDDCGRREDLPADAIKAADQHFDAVRQAAGQTNGFLPSAWMPHVAQHHVARWETELGLTRQQVLDVVRAVARRQSGPVKSPRYFDGPMQDLARELAAPPMQPAQGAGPYRSPGTSPPQGGGRSNYEYLLSLMQDEPGKDGANDARTAQ
ncbi:MAG: hypothetical protein EBR82_38180 [Caulobacteraceae bacterium]|nr:hypothetical protein [Caulobacteraceae bacterium]